MTTDNVMLVGKISVANEALKSSVKKGPRSDDHFFNNQVGIGSSSELLHGALEISLTKSSRETVVNGCIKQGGCAQNDGGGVLAVDWRIVRTLLPKI